MIDLDRCYIGDVRTVLQRDRIGQQQALVLEAA